MWDLTIHSSSGLCVLAGTHSLLHPIDVGPSNPPPFRAQRPCWHTVSCPSPSGLSLLADTSLGHILIKNVSFSSPTDVESHIFIPFLLYVSNLLSLSFMFLLQMGTNYKAALIPQRIRETIHGWGKSARRKRRLRIFTDDATFNTETSTVMSLEDDDNPDTPKVVNGYAEIELQPPTPVNASLSVANDTSRGVKTGLQPSRSLSSPVAQNFDIENSLRSSSMPIRR